MAFIRKGIETLLSDRELKRNTELITACKEALLVLQKNGSSVSGTAVVPEMSRDSDGLSIEPVFLPFELACRSKVPRVIVFSLDSIQKLVAYGHISRRFESSAFTDHMTTIVSKCFYGPQTDEKVQLQVLKALLTIVTSSNVQVHENALLLAIQTCYNIFLASRNLINQTTAKATLNQMLSYTFTKMELASLESCSLNEDEILTPNNNNNTKVNSVEDNDDVLEESFQIASSVLNAILTSVVVKKENSEKDDTYENDKGEKDNESNSDSNKRFSNLFQKDAFLVFRSLCKLALKPLPEGSMIYYGTTDSKSLELRSKILSLQLLLSILQNGGSTFSSHDIFVSALKQYLCVALSMNGVSPIGEIFELSLALFISLLTKYRIFLKSQIEIFFKEIVLNILEATSSSFDQKWMVIQGIGKIVQDPQIVVDIYVNYDCDLNAANIFERLVDDLSKISQGRQAFDVGASTHQYKRIRVKGLECLVCILKCMVNWSSELYVNPQSPSRKEGKEESSTDEDPSEFEKVKKHKDVLEAGIRIFNQRPSKGIKCLLDRGLLTEEAKSIAQFLHKENERLNKTTLGEFLGDILNKEIMYEYVDIMDFSGKNFVRALRYFLEGFRLPGEAQKIDRLMEKFASRYISFNPHQRVFASADTAYVLAYSIIMLTTDLHSSSVKKKMTKEEFIRNNRGINESEDLPEEYLSSIYEEIATSEIKMKSDTSTVGKVSFVTDQKKRHQIWTLESENISQTAGALMESASCRRDAFISVRHSHYVKPMFHLLWTPVLATFSVGLQDSDELEISSLCLGGIQCAIRIACIFNYSLERNAFIAALARFTLLTDNLNVSEMKAKNIDTIKTLISIAITDGNYLSSSWLHVMKVISQLEFAQMVGLPLSQKSTALYSPSEGLNEGPSNDSISEANSQSVIVAVDKIFTGSKNLNGVAIVEFISALCSVSKDEISSESHPRMFSLIKLVEISYYNMERIRLEWSRIWSVLGNHFNVVGCNDSQNISFFAVDSLKQLSLKFLEKGELKDFHFQKDFLRPFEFIMKNNKSVRIRDMVVRCISQMVQGQAKNIQSGWKNIFSVFTLSASDEDNGIVSLGFSTTESIVLDLMGNQSLSVIDFFTDAIKCLSEFACNSLFPDIAMEAIQLIRKCASYIVNGDVMKCNGSGNGCGNVNGIAEEDKEKIWIRGWFPILFELSCIMNRSKLDIRTRSLSVLFEIVKNYGSRFESLWWIDLFEVIFRIFDVSKLEDKRISSHSQEWIDTTCNHTLYSMTDVFNEFFTELCPILLESLLNKYEWCILQENDQLSKSAISCLNNLILTNETKFRESKTQGPVFNLLSILISSTFQKDGKSLKSLPNRICIHIEVLSSVKKTLGLFLEVLNSGDEKTERDSRLSIRLMIDSCLASHSEARAAIEDTTDKVLLPLLYRYETKCLLISLELLFRLLNKGTEQNVELDVQLKGVLQTTLLYYLSLSSKGRQEEWNGLLIFIFSSLTSPSLPDNIFMELASSLYERSLDILTLSLSKDLKTLIAECLKRIGCLYGLDRR